MRRRVLLSVMALALLAGLVVAAVIALRPLPDSEITLATGPEGSAYAAIGERYRALLAREGVTVRLVATNGSYDNVARLRDPKSGVSAAFVQAGSVDAADTSGLLSLGTMFYEPIWIFCRCSQDGHSFHEVVGRHISIGPEGSASRALALRLLKMNGVDLGSYRFEAYQPEEAADALIAGRIEATIIDTGWDSAAVHKLLADPSITLVGFPRADAYVALLPFLSKVVLPMGVASLAENRPPTDVTLVAPKASLVVREDLHPALQYLLIDAATKIHGGPGVFNRAGDFPAPEMIDLPLSQEAQHMYRSGPSFLRRHLPYWLAELAQRMLILLVPLIGILYPITQLAPDAWRWQIERRISGMYRDLRRIEHAMRTTPEGPRRAELHAELDALELRAARAKLPDSFAAPAYELKQNIRFVQERFR